MNHTVEAGRELLAHHALDDGALGSLFGGARRERGDA
jgi:hypothetical protein